MTDKILSDPFYGDLYTTFGQAFIDEAGYFVDGRKGNETIDYAPTVPCTPLSSWANLAKEAGNPCVILSTGSFCPIHQGHIDMMLEAKKGLESQGFTVLHGYLSPGHDEYIFSKNKHLSIPIHERLALIEKSIQAHDWLSIDPWEGLFTTCALNFTEVVHRLTLYIEHFTGLKIPVFFMCGGDNARFALTFRQKGYCVVGQRPGYEDRYEKYKNQTAPQSDRIFWVGGNSEMSSTQIKTPYILPEKKALSIRLQDSGKADRDFENNLMDVFKARFTTIRKRYVSHTVAPENLHPGNHYISLDPFVSARYNLSISRHYDLFGTKKLGYGQRPYSALLSDQLREIPPDKALTLYDDDICTGQTMAFAKKLLKDNNIAVSEMYSPEHSTGNYIEVLDSRDFLLGAPNGGLVIKQPNGQLCRMPYLYPYVCPFQRASIHDPVLFSLQVWELNRQYYQVRPGLIEDNQTLGFLLDMGFQPTDTLEYVCQWHIDWLSPFKDHDRGIALDA